MFFIPVRSPSVTASAVVIKRLIEMRELKEWAIAKLGKEPYCRISTSHTESWNVGEKVQLVMREGLG